MSFLDVTGKEDSTKKKLEQKNYNDVVGGAVKKYDQQDKEWEDERKKYVAEYDKKWTEETGFQTVEEGFKEIEKIMNGRSEEQLFKDDE